MFLTILPKETELSAGKYLTNFLSMLLIILNEPKQKTMQDTYG